MIKQFIKIWMAFMIGGMAGVAVMWLIAPMSGEETRRILSENLADAQSKANIAIEEAQEKLVSGPHGQHHRQKNGKPPTTHFNDSNRAHSRGEMSPRQVSPPLPLWLIAPIESGSTAPACIESFPLVIPC